MSKEILKKYYKAILSYGHVGIKREISVARYLELAGNHDFLDVYNLISEMPATKANCVRSLKQITYAEYIRGKEAEQNEFYIKNLFPQTS